MVMPVAIVGAGVAGLAARRVILESGAGCHLFDKGRGPGGRVSRRRVEEHNRSLHFDHGAQYFTARDRAFRQVVAAWVDSGAVAAWDPRIVTLVDGEMVDSRGTTERYVGVPGMSRIGQELLGAADDTVRFSCPIVRAERVAGEGSPWMLTAKEGERFGPYGALVVAVPPAQARDILPQEAAPQGVLSAVEVDPCWALMVAWEGDFPMPFDAAFVRGHAVRWLARNDSKPGRPAQPCLVAHADPLWSRDHLEEDGESVAVELVRELRELLAPVVPWRSPVWVRAHRWRYAQPRRLPAGMLQGDCWWSDGERLALCGDWCTAGRVEGAWLSGTAAAGRLLAAGIL